MRIKTIPALIAIIIMLTVHVMAESKNLVLNSGFEEGPAGEISSWSKYSWENQGFFDIDESEAHSGLKSAKISNELPSDSRLKQQISVKGNTYYKLSCWIRTENVGFDAKGANLSVDGLLDTSMDIQGSSNGWKYVELYGKTAKKQKAFTITIGLGGYGSLNTGKAWFDNVSVEEINKLPQGVNSVNLYTDAANGASKSSHSLLIVLFSLLISFAAVLIIVMLRTKKPEDPCPNSGVPIPSGKKPSGIEIIKLKLGKNDYIIMASMTLLYLVIALINLGSLHVPNTYWKPAAAGESFIVDLGREADISRVYYYPGIDEGHYTGGTYKLEYADADGSFTPLASIEKKELYIWKYHNVSARTNRIRITVTSPGGTLNEIGFFESGSTKPLTDIKLIEMNINNRSIGSIESLFDEQHKIPYKPSFLTGMYFDEIYHARTAYEHIHRMEPYESTHPPLGKIFISLGILLFGMNPFGWRIIGTLFGAAMIPLMYLFGKKLFGKSFYGFCAAFLMMFDFMHFTQTRIATIDVYVTFFVILMYYYMSDFFINKPYDLGFKKSLKPLFLSGLFFGMGAASKWIALYGAAGLALLFFAALATESIDYTQFSRISKSKRPSWYNDFVPLYLCGTMLSCVLFFVIIPGLIYVLSYIPFMMVPGAGHELKDIFPYQLHMYNYHSKGVLNATHPFSSSWWQWPIMTKPVWYYSGGDTAAGNASTIAAFGNPAIWWLGIGAVALAITISILKREKRMIVVFTAIASQYLPWMFVSRLTFIYHYFSIVPFVILSIVYVIKNMVERVRETKYLVYLYLFATAALFIIFYPVLSGLEVSSRYIQGLKWLKTWYF